MENITRFQEAKVILIQPGQTGVRVIKTAMPGEYEFFKRQYGNRVKGNGESFVILDKAEAHTYLYLVTKDYIKIRFDIRRRIQTMAFANNVNKKRITQAFCNKLKNNLPNTLEVIAEDYHDMKYWNFSNDSENTLMCAIARTIAEEELKKKLKKEKAPVI